MKWTNTIDEIRKDENLQWTVQSHQWAIGDAIKKDVSTEAVETRINPDFDDCSSKLKELGYDYSEAYLRRLFLTAMRFPRSKRLEDVSWNVHHTAGNPENLEHAIEELRKLKRPLSQDNVQWLMNVWRENAELKRLHEEAEVKREAEEATNELNEARKKKLQAKNPAARKKAQEEIEEAKAKKEKVKARRNAAPKKAKHDDALDAEALPEKTDLEIISLCTSVENDAKSMANKLEVNLKKLDGISDRIPVKTANLIVSTHTAIIRNAQKIIDHMGNVRQHAFKTIQGGAA